MSIKGEYGEIASVKTLMLSLYEIQFSTLKDIVQ